MFDEYGSVPEVREQRTWFLEQLRSDEAALHAMALDAYVVGGEARATVEGVKRGVVERDLGLVYASLCLRVLTNIAWGLGDVLLSGFVGAKDDREARLSEVVEGLRLNWREWAERALDPEVNPDSSLAGAEEALDHERARARARRKDTNKETGSPPA